MPKKKTGIGMSITIKNVTKKYGEQVVLDNVDISVDKGEVVGFLGPNGAGKSTLMKIICCYSEPTSGTVDVCGYDILKDPLEVKRRIGYLQESNPLYVDMYISEYLEFIARIHDISDIRQRVGEVMELTGLMPERRKIIRQLSKGYKQRVGLAQALIHNPEVLILDEPTTGLDPSQLTEIRQLIKELGKDKTVVLSTHIMQEVEAICDRVIIIDKGKIIANDSTENIMMYQSKSLIEVEIKKPCPVKPFTTFSQGGGVRVISDGGESVRVEISYNTGEEIRDKIFEYAIANHYIVLSMSKNERKLEDIFIGLVNKKD